MQKCLSILLFLTVTLSQGQDWKRVELASNMAISFPNSPEKTVNGNKEIFNFSSDVLLLNVVRVDMSSNPNFQITESNIDEFFQGVINGTLAAATNSTLISTEKVKLLNYQGRDISYTKDFNGLENIAIRKRIFLVKKDVIVMEHWNLSGVDQNTTIKTFFDSFTIN